MTMTLAVGPIVALIAGILILIVPRLLNYIVAFYLIIIGVLGLVGPARGALSAEAISVPPAVMQHAPPVNSTGSAIRI
jgi:hypothetical protein